MLSEKIYNECQRFLRRMDGFSYDFEKNGESRLLNRLSTLDVATVIDVGANTGEWTNIALDRFPNATVHAFEISESTFQSMQENVSDSRAVLNNMGLSNEDASIQYKDYGENSGLNTIVSDAVYWDGRVEPTYKTAQVAMGDRYCKDHTIDTIDILKIDVEGAEQFVLEGFNEKLRSKQVRLVQFEYGYTNGDTHFLMRDFYRLFEEFGYRVGLLRADGVRFIEWSYKLNDFRSGPNYVAVQRDDAEIIEIIASNRK